jgi:hypothetical protein
MMPPPQWGGASPGLAPPGQWPAPGPGSARGSNYGYSDDGRGRDGGDRDDGRDNSRDRAS